VTVYVYGITRAGLRGLAESLGGVPGIGDPPRPVRILSQGTLAAVVSDCPDGLRPRRRDLLAHQRVLAAVALSGQVLPLRFGSVAANDAGVRATLAGHADLYHDQLASLADRVEYNVKVGHHEEAALRLILAESPEIRQLRAAARSEAGGTYEQRLRLGQLVAEAVRAREARDARTVEDALVPHAERHARGPAGAGRLANLSFLVGQETSADFLAAVGRLRETGPHLDIRVSGPLPPYSFVRTPRAEAV
jgi:hypothetical protein